MPRKKKKNTKTVETLTHDEASRKNIPTAEYQSVMYKEEQSPIRVAYDVDGNTENRRGTISVFNGPKPTIQAFDTQEEEIESVRKWLFDRMREGVVPHEIGVFVRSANELDRARKAIETAGHAFKILDENIATITGHISISTMYLAKGLEFRAVVVMACDDEVIPLQERIETVTDDTDLEEVYNTERHLLYVACTRARDYLLVTGVDPASEFLDDLRM